MIQISQNVAIALLEGLNKPIALFEESLPPEKETERVYEVSFRAIVCAHKFGAAIYVYFFDCAESRGVFISEESDVLWFIENLKTI
jgi:hypothetical protein